MATLQRARDVPATAVPHGVHSVRRWPARLAAAAVDRMLILRVGLAALFLVNALIAWVDPDQFTMLVGMAGVNQFVRTEAILWAIRVNDLVIGAAILFAWNR